VTDTARSEPEASVDRRSSDLRDGARTGAHPEVEGAPISVARSVAMFAVAGAVAWLLLAVAGALLFRSIAREEAVRDAERFTRLAARAVVAPRLTPGVLDGDPRALAALDRVVRDRLLRPTGVIRVKIWGLPTGGSSTRTRHASCARATRSGATSLRSWSTVASTLR